MCENILLKVDNNQYEPIEDFRNFLVNKNYNYVDVFSWKFRFSLMCCDKNKIIAQVNNIIKIVLNNTFN